MCDILSQTARCCAPPLFTALRNASSHLAPRRRSAREYLSLQQVAGKYTPRQQDFETDNLKALGKQLKRKPSMMRSAAKHAKYARKANKHRHNRSRRSRRSLERESDEAEPPVADLERGADADDGGKISIIREMRRYRRNLEGC